MMRNALVALLLSAVLLGCVAQQPSEGTLNIKVLINNGTGVMQSVVSVANGSAALAAFEKAATLNITRHPAYGAFVTGVNGLEQSASENRYWQYYVDGVLAPVGVDAYKLDRDVTLEFRYESPQLS
ncbi:hypothetical protein COT29_02050 [Candidatus Micrarchaeota archaeon CG08_land_8_20_14_0_20_59_11]|nr:MAG: hypothetical protein COT29_02050 [Candidatus Micrarchaeota archaeon CG08_land_8_20_14_0_20_59_11]